MTNTLLVIAILAGAILGLKKPHKREQFLRVRCLIAEFDASEIHDWNAALKDAQRAATGGS